MSIYRYLQHCPHSLGLRLIVTLIARLYYFQFSMMDLRGVWTADLWIRSHPLYQLSYLLLTKFTFLKISNSIFRRFQGRSKLHNRTTSTDLFCKIMVTLSSLFFPSMVKFLTTIFFYSDWPHCIWDHRNHSSILKFWKCTLQNLLVLVGFALFLCKQTFIFLFNDVNVLNLSDLETGRKIFGVTLKDKISLE